MVGVATELGKEAEATARVAASSTGTKRGLTIFEGLQWISPGRFAVSFRCHFAPPPLYELSPYHNTHSINSGDGVLLNLAVSAYKEQQFVLRVDATQIQRQPVQSVPWYILL